MKRLAAILGLGFWFFFYAYPNGHPVYLSASFSEPAQCEAARGNKAQHGFQVTACRDSEDF
jgi:hypothetical protein